MGLAGSCHIDSQHERRHQVLGNLREGRIIYHHRWRALAAGAALIASSLLGASIVLSSFSEARPVTASGAAHSPTGPCPGKQVEPTRYATYRGKRVGALRVYYDPSTGKNCAQMDHTRRTWGKARMTYVYIRICRGNRRPGDRCRGGTRGVADRGHLQVLRRSRHHKALGARALHLRPGNDQCQRPPAVGRDGSPGGPLRRLSGVSVSSAGSPARHDPPPTGNRHVRLTP
jgi:hypothetical protein